MGDPASLESVGIELDFVIFKLKTEWVNDPKQRAAAYALYIEYSTRVAAQQVDLDKGLVREALASLHALFAITRGILREAGPVAGVGDGTIGGIAVAVLNGALRPFLSKWHPLLLDWELNRPPTVSPREHERRWNGEMECRGDLEKMRLGLVAYTRALRKIAER